MSKGKPKYLVQLIYFKGLTTTLLQNASAASQRIMRNLGVCSCVVKTGKLVCFGRFYRFGRIGKLFSPCGLPAVEVANHLT